MRLPTTTTAAADRAAGCVPTTTPNRRHAILPTDRAAADRVGQPTTTSDADRAAVTTLRTLIPVVCTV